MLTQSCCSVSISQNGIAPVPSLSFSASWAKNTTSLRQCSSSTEWATCPRSRGVVYSVTATTSIESDDRSSKTHRSYDPRPHVDRPRERDQGSRSRPSSPAATSTSSISTVQTAESNAFRVLLRTVRRTFPVQQLVHLM